MRLAKCPAGARGFSGIHDGRFNDRAEWHRIAGVVAGWLRYVFRGELHSSSEHPVDLLSWSVRMPSGPISRGGWLAIGLGIVGSVIAFGNVIIQYRSSGDLAWGKIALAVGVPILIYAIVSGRRSG